jgi:hypothetical protein
VTALVALHTSSRAREHELRENLRCLKIDERAPVLVRLSNQRQPIRTYQP